MLRRDISGLPQRAGRDAGNHTAKGLFAKTECRSVGRGFGQIYGAEAAELFRGFTPDGDPFGDRQSDTETDCQAGARNTAQSPAASATSSQPACFII